MNDHETQETPAKPDGQHFRPGGIFHFWNSPAKAAKRAPIPQAEIIFANEPFALVPERAEDPARIAADQARAQATAKAAIQFERENQLTLI